jgi:hypothetical protein
VPLQRAEERLQAQCRSGTSAVMASATHRDGTRIAGTISQSKREGIGTTWPTTSIGQGGEQHGGDERRDEFHRSDAEVPVEQSASSNRK